jgi:hypothetical protein
MVALVGLLFSPLVMKFLGFAFEFSNLLTVFTALGHLSF